MVSLRDPVLVTLGHLHSADLVAHELREENCADAHCRVDA